MEETEKSIRKEIENLKQMIENREEKEVIKNQKEKIDRMLKEYLEK